MIKSIFVIVMLKLFLFSYIIINIKFRYIINFKKSNWNAGNNKI